LEHLSVQKRLQVEEAGFVYRALSPALSEFHPSRIEVVDA
jgi:hypothetical protein